MITLEVAASVAIKNPIFRVPEYLQVGNEDAAKLDAATGQHGFLAKVVRMGLEMGDTDTDYLGYYRRALLEGYAVIAVVTHDDA